LIEEELAVLRHGPFTISANEWAGFSLQDGAAGEPFGKRPTAKNWCSMRAVGTFKAPRPTGRLAGDVRRAFIAYGAGFGLCVGAVTVGTWAHSAMNRGAQSQANGESLSTGSVLVVSPNGNYCRERTIDNSNWQIRDNGWVDCTTALARSAAASGDKSAGSRLDLIRESFRK